MKNREGFLEQIKEYEANTCFKPICLNDYSFGVGKVTKHLNDVKEYNLTNYSTKMFLERLGLSCTGIYENQGLAKEFINKFIEHAEDIIVCSFQQKDNDTILAFHSSGYRPMKYSALINGLEDSLQSKYKDCKFDFGYLDDEYLIVDYKITDPHLLNPYLNFFGISKPKEVSVIARLISSNIGLSGANVGYYLQYRMFERGDVVEIPLSYSALQHKGEATLTKFIENTKNSLNLVYDIDTNLLALKDIQIKYPTHCLINIAEKVGISAKKIEPVAEMASDFLAGFNCNALEIYKYLNFIKADDQKEKLFLKDKISRTILLLKEDAGSFDIPKIKWKRLKISADENQTFIPLGA